MQKIKWKRILKSWASERAEEQIMKCASPCYCINTDSFVLVLCCTQVYNGWSWTESWLAVCQPFKVSLVRKQSPLKPIEILLLQCIITESWKSDRVFCSSLLYQRESRWLTFWSFLSFSVYVTALALLLLWISQVKVGLVND